MQALIKRLATRCKTVLIGLRVEDQKSKLNGAVRKKDEVPRKTEKKSLPTKRHRPQTHRMSFSQFTTGPRVDIMHKCFYNRSIKIR